jgi:hypothetical protein
MIDKLYSVFLKLERGFLSIPLPWYAWALEREPRICALTQAALLRVRHTQAAPGTRVGAPQYRPLLPHRRPNARAQVAGLRSHSRVLRLQLTRQRVRGVLRGLGRRATGSSSAHAPLCGVECHGSKPHISLVDAALPLQLGLDPLQECVASGRAAANWRWEFEWDSGWSGLFALCAALRLAWRGRESGSALGPL